MATFITNGQVAATATAIVDGATYAPPSGRVDVIFQNTGANTQTLILTLGHTNFTTRSLFRCELQQYEQLKITALGLGGGDTLYGTTSDASVVDVTVFASEAKVMTFEIYSANGTSKATGTLRQMLQALEDIAGFETVDLG